MAGDKAGLVTASATSVALAATTLAVAALRPLFAWRRVRAARFAAVAAVFLWLLLYARLWDLDRLKSYYSSAADRVLGPTAR
ncbi:hypothetical protein HK405_000216, partial [Cladochytrium tenue]